MFVYKGSCVISQDEPHNKHKWCAIFGVWLFYNLNHFFYLIEDKKA